MTTPGSPTLHRVARFVPLAATAFLAACSGGGGDNAPTGATTTTPTTTPGPVATVTVSAPATSLLTTGNLLLNATAKDAAGRTVTSATFTWTSGDTTVATVSITGLVSGALPGNVTITASSAGVTGTAALSVRAPTLTAVSNTGVGGELSVHVNDEDYAAFPYGFSYYTSVATVNPATSGSLQLGWGVWITPNNTGFGGQLCPNNFPIYQSLEGGAGTWGSLKFPGANPKFLIVATGDCYQQGVSAPAYNAATPVPTGKLGLAQLSNRLLIPPDNLQFTPPTGPQFLGYGWIALPIIPATTSPLGIATSNQNWTIFLNATNFQGPLAFWVPEYWTSIDASAPAGVGRGLDARPALDADLGLEINSMQAFTATDANGVKYRRVPRLTFGTVDQRATLLRDPKYYNKSAVFDLVNAWMNGGAAPTAFVGAGIMTPNGFARTVPDAHMADDNKPVRYDGQWVTVNAPSGGTGIALAMDWSGALAPGAMPEYYRFEDSVWRAIPATAVPRRTWLSDQTFSGQTRSTIPRLDVTSASSPWISSGWAAGPFTTMLNDGSTVEYVWYKFTEQPAIKRLNLDAATTARLQAWAEDLHNRWGVNGVTIPPPTAGTLATLDPGMIVTPPANLAKGYVPIAIRQY